MPEDAPSVPASDRAVGIGFYLSTSPGVPGRLKATAEEFRVREVSSYPRPDPAGPYTVLRLESRGWEQHELAEAVARRLGLARRSISWSGTKDRRAVSERLFAYRGPPPTGDLGLAGVTVVDAYPSREGLVLGRHYANAFEVHVGELAEPASALATYRAVEAELRAAGGFPNFFGAQRFGEVRPITHEVGRWIVRGDLARAVDAYLIDRPASGVEGAGDRAREAFGEHRDARRALGEFPHEYRFERSILDRLAHGDPPERALRALPHELRRLFVHAFQSYVFNRHLSSRHDAGLPLDRPVVGDMVVRLGRDGTYRGQDVAPVGEENLPECTELVRRGRALVAGPLVGASTRLAPGEPTRLLERILAEEQVAPASFSVPAAPELGSEGTWRALLVPLPPLGLEADATGVWFRFSLPKGAYATVALREFLKPGPGPRAPLPGVSSGPPST
ncbi:MAG TPA: tRNA pseudouridine(13) synthase TruD [Thermoplasmata archaeon]|nr:tRNA pseudouridine(13) synthase TruD [Thermoplasmata archaeon]